MRAFAAARAALAWRASAAIPPFAARGCAADAQAAARLHATQPRNLSTPPRHVLEQALLYASLSKVKLSGFVVSTACAGFLLGSGEAVEWERLAWTAAGTWGAAACANTLNQVAEARGPRSAQKRARLTRPCRRATTG